MILISASPSPFARKVRMALIEKGIAFTVQNEVPWHADSSTPRYNPLEQLPVLIPETYVQDLPVRLGLYRRIGALASDAETQAMAAELVDRFGDLPPEVDNLLQVVTLKRMCRDSGVEKLEAGPKGMVVAFRGNAFRNPSGLVGWLGSRKGIRLRPDHKLAIAKEMTVAERMRMGRDVLGNLSRLAAQVAQAA